MSLHKVDGLEVLNTFQLSLCRVKVKVILVNMFLVEKIVLKKFYDFLCKITESFSI